MQHLTSSGANSCIKSINSKTPQLTHVEDRLLKEVINLVGFLIIDFFTVKDLKMLAIQVCRLS